MTHDELQELIEQGYIVHMWRAVPNENMSCPKCGRFSAWGQQQKFPNDQKEVTMYCPKCGSFWEAPLKVRFIAVHPRLVGDVTE